MIMKHTVVPACLLIALLLSACESNNLPPVEAARLPAETAAAAERVEDDEAAVQESEANEISAQYLLDCISEYRASACFEDPTFPGRYVLPGENEIVCLLNFPGIPQIKAFPYSSVSGHSESVIGNVSYLKLTNVGGDTMEFGLSVEDADELLRVLTENSVTEE